MVNTISEIFRLLEIICLLAKKKSDGEEKQRWVFNLKRWGRGGGQGRAGSGKGWVREGLNEKETLEQSLKRGEGGSSPVI